MFIYDLNVLPFHNLQKGRSKRQRWDRQPGVAWVCITFLSVLWQMTTNSVAQNTTNLLSHSSGGQSGWWLSRAGFLLEVLGEKLFPWLFQPQKAACILGSQSCITPTSAFRCHIPFSDSVPLASLYDDSCDCTGFDHIIQDNLPTLKSLTKSHKSKWIRSVMSDSLRPHEL